VTARVAPESTPLGPRLIVPPSARLEVDPFLALPEAPIVTPFPRGPSKEDGFPFHVVIPSADPQNCARCVESVFRNEPGIPPGHVVVVDDGARPGCVLEGIDWREGPKPFIFARNVNLGVQWASTDVVLLNDDAVLETPNGLMELCAQARTSSSLGVLSAAVRGSVGNKNQLWHGAHGIRPEARTLAFICVYIKESVFQAVGLLDERYSGYGYEDDDFCYRILRAGMTLGICEGCVVDHSRPDASIFRRRPDLQRLERENRAIFERKWGVRA